MSEPTLSAGYTKETLQQLRQRLLHQIEASRKAILELSDEELVSVTGGFLLPTTNPGIGPVGSQITRG